MNRRGEILEVIETYQLKDSISKIMKIDDAAVKEKEILLDQGYVIGFNGIYYQKID